MPTTSFLKWQDCLLKLISDDLNIYTNGQPSFSARFTAHELIDMEGYLKKLAFGVWLSLPELFTETALASFSLGIPMACIRIKLEVVSVVLAMTSYSQPFFCLAASQFQAMLYDGQSAMGHLEKQ